MGSAVIGPLMWHRSRGSATASIEVYAPHPNTAVLTIRLNGARGGQQAEAVQLDGEQRMELAKMLLTPEQLLALAARISDQPSR